MEKYVFGYFQTLDHAKKAAYELKQKGFEVSLDFISTGRKSAHDTGNDDFKNPFQAPSHSLTESTLGNASPWQDSRILLSTHPDASGLSDGEPLSDSENISLTVFFTHEKERSQIKQILNQYGARE